MEPLVHKHVIIRAEVLNPLAGIVGRYVCGGNDEVLPLTQVGYTDDWVLAK